MLMARKARADNLVDDMSSMLDPSLVSDTSSADLCADWQTAIKAAAKLTLPSVITRKMRARNISTRTRKLFDTRANMSRTKHSLAEFDCVQAQIKESSM